MFLWKTINDTQKFIDIPYFMKISLVVLQYDQIVSGIEIKTGKFIMDSLQV